MKSVHMIAWILVIVGGLNWLAEGLFVMGIGSFLPEMVARVIYVVVGISAVYLIIDHKKSCKHCEPSAPGASSM